MFNKILINKNNLIKNIKQVIKKNQKSKICAMVKANAYGVGVVDVVKILDEYVDFFGVACFFEAQQIQDLTNKPILIFGAIEKNCVDSRFSYCCGDLNDLKLLVSLNLQIKIHLKVNTGMNRYGFKNLNDFEKALKTISKSKLILEGVFTHFATVDDFVDIQFKRLKSFVKLCYKYKLYPIVHADNSAVNERFNHKLNMVRVGYNLFIKNNEIFPVVEIKSRIVEIQEVKKNESIGYGNKCIAGKNTKVAIIPIGYADGFDMGYIGIQLKIKNQLCRVLNVCMDCFMLDISNVKLKKGDDIYVLNKFNSLKYYANYDKTHEYEIITRFSHARATRKLVVSVSSYRHNIQ